MIPTAEDVPISNEAYWIRDRYMLEWECLPGQSLVRSLPDGNYEPGGEQPTSNSKDLITLDKDGGEVVLPPGTKSLLESLPLELVFMVFFYTRPLDLLHLAWTNKSLRSYLMSKQAAQKVWKACRESLIPSVPFCPPDQSEPQWAFLLFTEYCTMCCKPDIHDVSWHLRLRGCEDCIRDQLITKQTAENRFPDIVDIDTVVDVLPFTRSRRGCTSANLFKTVAPGAGGSNDSNPVPQNRFYYAASIQKMGVLVNQYWDLIDANDPTAAQELDAFVARRQLFVTRVIWHGEMCLEWIAETAQAKAQLIAKKVDERRDGIRERLLALGHDARDIGDIPAMNDQSTTKMTDEAWEEIRSQCVSDVLSSKQNRIRQEMRWHFSRNRQVGETLYDEYISRQNIQKMALVADSNFVMERSIFRDVYERKYDTSAAPEDFSEAMETLPDLCMAWLRDKKREMVTILVAGGHDRGGVNTSIDDDDFGCLELATSGFYCSRSKRLLFAGDGNLGAHACNSFYINADVKIIPTLLKDLSWNLKCFKHDDSIRDGAVSVVRAAGLDPNITTSAQMDDVNERFYCAECTEQLPLFRSWRNCVTHTKDKHAEDPLRERWTRLTSEARNMAVAQENADTKDIARRYHCIYCPDGVWSLSNVIRHFRSDHGRRPPRTDEYYIDPWVPPTPTAFYATPPGPQRLGFSYKCKHCQTSPQNTKRDRTFLLDGVKRHLSASHGVLRDDITEADYIDVAIAMGPELQSEAESGPTSSPLNPLWDPSRFALLIQDL